MTSGDRPNFFRSGPKRPAPEHGIKIKKAGSTWWGQRWIDALERMAPEYAKRMGRGRTYARGGRTHDLSVEPGLVRARVTGSRAEPYAVSLRLVPLTAANWESVNTALAAHAAFSAELLAGRMPEAIDEAFAAAGVSLFPSAKRDLVTECSCPDWANPCKHVAACHYVLGEAFDRDPFLLFELRGRTREQVLAALRAARGGEETSRDAEAGLPLTVALEALCTEDYDKPRAELPRLALSFEAAPVHGALLGQLGKPAAWSGEGSPAELLQPLVTAAAERARALALSDDEPPTAPPTDEKPQRKRRKPR